jgi:hypothetical protein
MEMFDKLKNIIAYLFLILSLGSMAAIINHYCTGVNDKISAEWQSQLLFSLGGVFFTISSGAFGCGLLFSKRWSFYLYSCMLTIWLILILKFLFDTSTESLTKSWLENLFGIIAFILLPISIEVYLIKIKEKSLTQ